jgi:hypothetical protein
MQMPDDLIGKIARDLADALRSYARERRSEDQQEVRRLLTSLCAARRAELAAPAAEHSAQ